MREEFRVVVKRWEGGRADVGGWVVRRGRWEGLGRLEEAMMITGWLMRMERSLKKVKMGWCEWKVVAF